MAILALAVALFPLCLGLPHPRKKRIQAETSVGVCVRPALAVTVAFSFYSSFASLVDGVVSVKRSIGIVSTH